MKRVSKSVSETAGMAEEIIGKVSQEKHAGATVLALYGDLGSGKTTFVQELGKHLGIMHSMQSPTFVIMKRYKLPTTGYKSFIHIDAYRLDKPEELARLGFEQLRADPDNLIAIEWAERIEKFLPRDCTRIRFGFVNETIREIEMLE